MSEYNRAKHWHNFITYANRFLIDETESNRIQLKILHTKKVTEVMDTLTSRLNVKESLCQLAWICALYHDIGRFEQLKKYHTFLDAKSIDHAALGCEIIKKEGLLTDLAVREQQMILTAIQNHNRYEIEADLDGDTLFLCQLIRDADKCDIFRVFAQEDMVDTMGKSIEEVETETITPIVFHTLKQGKSVKKEDRKTGLDIWMGFLGFLNDMNFKESIDLVKEEGYYKIPFLKASFKHETSKRQVFEILKDIENR